MGRIRAAAPTFSFWVPRLKAGAVVFATQQFCATESHRSNVSHGRRARALTCR